MAPPAVTRAPAHVPPSGAGVRTDASTSRQQVAQQQIPPQQMDAATAQAQAAAAAAAAAAQDTLSVILVTAGYDHTIRFWEAWSGVCSRTVQHPDSQVNRLSISPDKRFLAAAANTHVRLYDCSQGGMGAGSVSGTGTAGAAAAATAAAHGHGGNPIATLDGHHGNVTAIAWHCDAKWLVTGSEDGTLKIWDTRTSRAQRIYDHSAPVNDVVVHPNQGELISCDQAGAVKVWDLSVNKCSHELVPVPDLPMRSVTVASDGSCLVAGNNKVSYTLAHTKQAAVLTCFSSGICVRLAHPERSVRRRREPHRRWGGAGHAFARRPFKAGPDGSHLAWRRTGQSILVRLYYDQARDQV